VKLITVKFLSKSGIDEVWKSYRSNLIKKEHCLINGVYSLSTYEAYGRRRSFMIDVLIDIIIFISHFSTVDNGLNYDLFHLNECKSNFGCCSNMVCCCSDIFQFNLIYYCIITKTPKTENLITTLFFFNLILSANAPSVERQININSITRVSV
jgi:hypothetical protein